MRGFFLRLLIHGLGLWITALVVPGVSFPGEPPSVLQVVLVTLIFAVVNALVRPLVALATCSLYVLTLGLFHFVVNALMLMLTAWLAGEWFDVDGFGWALLGALVLSVLGTILTWLLDPDDDDDVRRNPPPPGPIIEGR